MAISELRNIGLSIELRLYCILRQANWVVQKDDLPVEAVSGSPRTYRCKNFTRQFCWLEPIAPNTNDPAVTTRSLVVLKDGANTVSQANYTVNFRDSTITLDEDFTPTGTLTISALFWVVRVTEGYPTPEEFEATQLPSLAWDLDPGTGRPYAIGTSLQFRNRYVTIDIAARNNGERMDLLDDVQKLMARVPYVDMTEHRPFTGTGELDPEFDFVDQFVDVIPQDKKPRGSLLQPRRGGTTKEKFRGLVSVDFEKVS